MAIPKKPLVFDRFDFGDLTLADDRLLQSPGSYPNDLALGRALAGFLERYANWTREEIEAIQNKELLAIYKQVVEAMQASLVPLAKPPRSKTGRGRKRTPSPAGSTS